MPRQSFQVGSKGKLSAPPDPQTSLGLRAFIRKTKAMKPIVMSLMLSLYATTALAATCKETATEKNLAGAALTSFMTKCQKDAQASCDTAAQDKKLSGAAKTSFTTKCVKDATGQ
jgi:hypothetical protein